MVPLRLHLVVNRRVVAGDSFEAALKTKEVPGEDASDRSTARYAVEVLRSAFVIPAKAEVPEVWRLCDGLADAD